MFESSVSVLAGLPCFWFAILSLLGSFLDKNGSNVDKFKVHEARRYKVSKNFFDTFENSIAGTLEKCDFFDDFDITLFPDKQTMVQSDSGVQWNAGIDNLFQNLGSPNITELIWSCEAEHYETENEVNRLKTNNAKDKFIKLFDDAPVEVVSSWKKFMIKEGWVVNGWDENEFEVDLSDVWEEYYYKFLLDVESARVKEEHRGKI